MKSLMGRLFVAAAVGVTLTAIVAISAKASEYYKGFQAYGVGETALLDQGSESCGGSVTVEKLDNEVQVQFSGIKLCHNVSILDVDGITSNSSLSLEQGNYHSIGYGGTLSVPLSDQDGVHYALIRVNSNSGEHFNEFYVSWTQESLPPVNSVNSKALLQCGGKAKLKVNFNLDEDYATASSVTLSLKGVKWCDQYEVFVNGQELMGSDMDSSAKIEIPGYLIDRSNNTIEVIVKNYTGTISDEVSFGYSRYH